VPAKAGSGSISVEVGTKSATTTTSFAYDWIGVVTTYAGKAGANGYVDGSSDAARFTDPTGIAVDNNGNIYVAELFKHTIRKISPAGDVSTFAGQAGTSGSDDGTGSVARFNYPTGLAVDQNGNLYVTDQGNFVIRKITSDGVVTTIAGLAGQLGSEDGTGSAARFRNTSGITVDNSGNVYVTDQGNNTIRKITSAGVVTTIAGQVGVAGSNNGTGNAASFNNPTSIAVDNSGNLSHDPQDHSIRCCYHPCWKCWKCWKR
jgi:streptogramin lyase